MTKVGAGAAEPIDAAVLYFAFKGWMTEEGAGAAEPRCRGSIFCI